MAKHVAHIYMARIWQSGYGLHWRRRIHRTPFTSAQSTRYQFSNSPKQLHRFQRPNKTSLPKSKLRTHPPIQKSFTNTFQLTASQSHTSMFENGQASKLASSQCLADSSVDDINDTKYLNEKLSSSLLVTKIQDVGLKKLHDFN